ncbi:MAG TPA: ribosomal protein L7/L12 [Anaerolineae bacterium]|nr:ribosomal protein L7/L12 [Anaerolineae bacterium]
MISLPAGEREEIVRLILSGSKVAAVAKVRQLTGAGLKDAKDYVDSLAAKFGRD